MIREVAEQMHLNKVEMGFGMDHVHTEVIVLIKIVFEAPALLKRCHIVVALASLMS